MTFRIETVFDQHFFCQIGHDDADHPTDLDRRTWTCRICQQSVTIDMADQAGNTFLVERRPANEIRKGDYVVYRVKAGPTSVITAGRVTASNAYQGKGQLWHLAVAAFGSDRIPPDQYVSRVT